MPNFYITLIVKLPHGAQKPETYIDALFEAIGDEEIIGIRKTPEQITLEFRRPGGTEYGAIESAVRDFQNAVSIVRRGAGDVDETYHIYVEIDDERVGEAVVHFKQPLPK